MGPRSPLAPTEPCWGIRGCTPWLSIAISRSTTWGRTPETPLARELARVSMVARTTSSGAGSPISAAWEIMRLRWKRSLSSGEMRRFLSGPTPVLKP